MYLLSFCPSGWWCSDGWVGTILKHYVSNPQPDVSQLPFRLWPLWQPCRGMGLPARHAIPGALIFPGRNFEGILRLCRLWLKKCSSDPNISKYHYWGCFSPKMQPWLQQSVAQASAANFFFISLRKSLQGRIGFDRIDGIFLASLWAATFSEDVTVGLTTIDCNLLSIHEEVTCNLLKFKKQPVICNSSCQLSQELFAQA